MLAGYAERRVDTPRWFGTILKCLGATRRFRRSYYPAYFEDVDFCLRAANRLGKSGTNPFGGLPYAIREHHFDGFLGPRTEGTFVSRKLSGSVAISACGVGRWAPISARR
jgi:hypothetical protein